MTVERVSLPELGRRILANTAKRVAEMVQREGCRAEDIKQACAFMKQFGDELDISSADGELRVENQTSRLPFVTKPPASDEDPDLE